MLIDVSCSVGFMCQPMLHVALHRLYKSTDETPYVASIVHVNRCYTWHVALVLHVNWYYTWHLIDWHIEPRLHTTCSVGWYLTTKLTLLLPFDSYRCYFLLSLSPHCPKPSYIVHFWSFSTTIYGVITMILFTSTY